MYSIRDYLLDYIAVNHLEVGCVPEPYLSVLKRRTYTDTNFTWPNDMRKFADLISFSEGGVKISVPDHVYR